MCLHCKSEREIRTEWEKKPAKNTSLSEAIQWNCSMRIQLHVSFFMYFETHQKLIVGCSKKIIPHIHKWSFLKAERIYCTETMFFKHVFIPIKIMILQWIQPFYFWFRTKNPTRHKKAVSDEPWISKSYKSISLWERKQEIFNKWLGKFCTAWIRFFMISKTSLFDPKKK